MFSRLKDDKCEYMTKVKQSTSILSHQLDPLRYYSCNPCRATEGIIGGNNVSVYKGNLVDLESELRGQTRMASRCPKDLFAPGTVIQNKVYGNCPDVCEHGDLSGECLQKKCIKNLSHLPECKIIDYGPKVKNTGISLNTSNCLGVRSNAFKPARSMRKTNKKLDILWQGQQGIYQ